MRILLSRTSTRSRRRCNRRTTSRSPTSSRSAPTPATSCRADATLVSDAHTTEDLTAWGAPPPDQVIAHTNLYWSNQSAPGRTAGTVATEHVDFADTA